LAAHVKITALSGIGHILYIMARVAIYQGNRHDIKLSDYFGKSIKILKIRV